MANYPGGRNQSRKVYGYIRPPKQEVTVVVNNITKSFDAQSMVHHRDFFRVINDILMAPEGAGPGAEYDEDLITFNWETSKSKNFNITFTSNPIVVLEMVPEQQMENVNVFLDSSTTTNLTVQLSAPFSGSVLYRAIYASSYPSRAVRNVLSSAFTYTATAGYVDLTGSNFFTASYSSLGQVPARAWFTPYVVNKNTSANVALVNSSSYGLISTSGDISSNMSNRINFLFVIVP